MNSTFEDAVLDFDINLFQHSSNNAVGPSNKDKSRKAVFLSKRKMMATDSLVRKYYDKRLACRTLEKCLLTSKDEYKQACIESMEYREKCAALEDELKKLKMANSELEDKCVTAENQYEGMQSHAKQLQQLVKENEIVIESLKIEQQLEKANSKDYEKNNAHLQRENDHLIQNICLIKEVIFGKTKLTKELKSFLNKYGKSNDNHVSESEEISCDNFESPVSPASDVDTCNDIPVSTPAAEDNKVERKLQSININEENLETKDDESECSNEVVSSDTGRGSSLAYSDSDKCFNSPEYFNNHSPLAAELTRNKEKNTVDVCTSPLSIRDLTTVATSPIIFDEVESSQQTSDCLLTFRKPATCTPVITIDRVVSPIIVTQYVEKSTSPVKSIVCDIATSPLKLDNNTPICSNNNTVPNTQEKLCLELNNSNSLQDENSNDGEIQMILDTMRFNHNLITPIPTTPAKSKSHSVDGFTSHATQTSHSSVCLQGAKALEENFALKATVAKLAEEVLIINTMLKKLNSSENNNSPLNTGGTSVLNDEGIAKAKETSGQSTGKSNNGDIESSGAVTAPIDNKVDCDSKISKLKRISNVLFADFAPPSPSDEVQFGPRSPSPAPLVSPPSPAFLVPRSPAPPTPPASMLLETELGPNNENSESNDDLKLKSRLLIEQLTETVSDETLKDYDTYEHEILIELGPDCPESDRNSLYELLKGQSTQRHAPQETPISKPTKPKKASKLQKLRKKMLPKSKIKKVEVQLKRKRRLLTTRPTSNKEMNKADVLTNNKTAYERACKVMAEIKSKRKVQNDTLVNYSKKSPVLRKVTQKETSSSNLINSKTKPTHTLDDIVTKHNHIIVPNDLDNEYSPPPSNKNMASADIESARSNNTIHEDISTIASKPINSVLLLSDPQTIVLPLSDPQTIVRTRSQSRSIDYNDNTCNNQVAENSKERDLVMVDSKETYPDSRRTPPTLRMYGRTRGKSKSEGTLQINRIVTSGSTKPNMSTIEQKDCNNGINSEDRKRRKRPSVDKPDLPTKRILRSSTILHSPIEVDDCKSQSAVTPNEQLLIESKKEIISYDDIDIFDDTPVTNKQHNGQDLPRQAEHPKFGILCAFLDKYGKRTQKQTLTLRGHITDAVCKKLQDGITEIHKIHPKDTKTAMDKLVADLLTWSLNQFLLGLMKYLKDPERKIELYNKVNVPPAPPMTKTEQILIYVVSQLKVLVWPDIVKSILRNIEYTLFSFSHTPEFDIIEAMSHFYAVLCRYDKNRNRLRTFIIDAMYCLSYKAVPLIKQCLDVWMHILPLAHMGVAKNPLVTCLVYLLHFYKCDDKFNRVQEIRNILHRKYFYELTEWNETRILDMFRTSIIELRDNATERKMLRLALIILAKRHGARWCHNHIIKKMLLSIVEEPDVPERTKHFCVSLLGPLMKPYPEEMKVNCEIIMNYLFDLLNKNPSTEMEEAVFTSLIFISRHNQNRVIRALLFWKPEEVSREFEKLLRSYVQERPKKSWRTLLSRIPLSQT